MGSPTNHYNMVTPNSYLFVFIAVGLFSTGNCIKCYRNLTGDPEACPTSGGIVNTAQSALGGFWKTVKDGVQGLTGDDWIDDAGDKIKDATGIDITSHEKNKAWVQTTMGKLGLDFDVSGNCYVTYDKTTKNTVERGCGALGHAGKLGAEIVHWMQGKSFNLWANAVCFTVPGNHAQEVCLCQKEGCNADFATGREAAGISKDAKAAMCGDQECPMADLSKIDEKYDFNSACYTGGEDSIVRCFTTDVVLDPKAAALTRSDNSVDGYTLFNINGAENPAGLTGPNSGSSTREILTIVLGFAFAFILQI